MPTLNNTKADLFKFSEQVNPRLFNKTIVIVIQLIQEILRSPKCDNIADKATTMRDLTSNRRHPHKTSKVNNIHLRQTRNRGILDFIIAPKWHSQLTLWRFKKDFI